MASAVDADEEERVAFVRKHAADLEEESRRHVSAEAGAEMTRQNEEELRRKVTGVNLDDRKKKRRRPRRDRDDEDEAAKRDAEAETQAKRLVGGGSEPPCLSAPPPDRLGDLRLTDPNEMQRVLGSTVRFAQHAMLLAEQRLEEGRPRVEAIAFLAGIYQGLDDRAYAERALRAFGPATGVLDIYPLEVVRHLLDHVPDFFAKTRPQPLFGGDLRVHARPGAAVELQYEPTLRVRGFALEGGARPGYRFEPGDPDGFYLLRIEAEGDFEVLISAITRDGWILVDRVRVEIDAEAPEPPRVELTASEAPGMTEAPASAPEEPPLKTSSSHDGLPDELSQFSFPRRI